MDDAASGEMTEAIGGMVYVFDQLDSAEKLKVVVSSLGPTNPPDASWANLDTIVKEGRKDDICARPGDGESQNSVPIGIYRSSRTSAFLLFSPGVFCRNCDYEVR